MPLTHDPTLAAALLGAVMVAVFGILALAFSGSGAARRYKRRIAGVQDRARGTPRAASGAARSISRRQSATPRIDRLARRWLPRRDMLAARLARTGRSISIGQYAIGSLALTVIAAAGLVIFTKVGLLPGLLFGMVIGLGLPHWVIGRMGKRRLAAFIALFPDAIDLMVRALRSGLPISEAIISAGHEIDEPVAGELRGVENGMRLGRDLEALLWDTAGRIDTPEFRFFVIALSVQRETGGNLAETLANLSDVLRKRRQMRAKVRAMASETRATTMILGGLPIVVILILGMTSPEYLRPLYTDVRGFFLDALALAMLGTGIFVMNRMARFEI
ncbi:MAG TPA: type II secretion system F family protein [Stellaceae bacterium]|nr:type II secretion system F family protein [Stellaceae bacterium]